MVGRVLERTQFWEDPRNQTAVRDGSPALAESFADLEQYLLPIERMRTVALYAWGVADGLQVSATAGAAGVTVSPGLAFDAGGRQVVLADAGVAVTDQVVDASQIQNVPTVGVGPAGVTVDTVGLAPGEYLLTVTWREVLGDNDFVNASTWVHAPWLRLLDPAGFPDTGKQVVLARLTLGADGLVATAGLTAGERRTIGAQPGRVLLRAVRAQGGGTDPLLVEQQVVAELAPNGDGDVVVRLLGAGPPRTALTIEQVGGAVRIAERLAVAGDAAVGGALTATTVTGGTLSGSTLTVSGTATVTELKASSVTTDSLWLSGPLTLTEVSIDDLTVEKVLRVGPRSDSQAALTVVDARPDNNWNTAAFAKPSAGPNWSHLHWGSTGDWYIRSAASAGRVILQDTGGRVGVGTGNPQATLDVAGTMALNNRLAMSSGDTYLRLNQTNAFSSGVHTPGLLSTGSINIGGRNGWGSPGFGHLGLAGGIDAGGVVHAFQYQTTGQSWLRGQVYTGEVFGHWDGKATLHLFGSRIWDGGDGWLQLLSGGGKTYLRGDVTVQGKLIKGGGGFRIDHPQDPEGKYLSHSFVESPEMVNLYTGVVVTGSEGTARVELPDYFEALNTEPRFQLTVVGTLALATVEGGVRGNAFTIRTDQPGVTVSWQVTGVRQDSWAQANRIAVVQDKSARESGTFMHPELFGDGAELEPVAGAAMPAGVTAPPPDLAASGPLPRGGF